MQFRGPVLLLSMLGSGWFGFFVAWLLGNREACPDLSQALLQSREVEGRKAEASSSRGTQRPTANGQWQQQQQRAWSGCVWPSARHEHSHCAMGQARAAGLTGPGPNLAGQAPTAKASFKKTTGSTVECAAEKKQMRSSLGKVFLGMGRALVCCVCSLIGGSTGVVDRRTRWENLVVGLGLR